MGRSQWLPRAQPRLLLREGRSFPNPSSTSKANSAVPPRAGAVEEEEPLKGQALGWSQCDACLRYPKAQEGAGASHSRQPVGGTSILPARSRVVTGDWQLPRGRRGGEPSPAAIFSSSRSVFSLTVSPLWSSLGPSIGDVYPAWHLMGCDTGWRGERLPSLCSGRYVGAREEMLGGRGGRGGKPRVVGKGPVGAPFGESCFSRGMLCPGRAGGELQRGPHFHQGWALPSASVILRGWLGYGSWVN